METLQSYKQYLRLNVRFGSIKNVLEIVISIAWCTKKMDLIGEYGTSSPFPEGTN